MTTSEIPFYKERSIKGYMADAWKMIALNWKDYLLTLTPFLLIAGIADALFFEFTLHYVCKQALPAYLFLSSDGDIKVAQWMATPNIGNAIYLTLSALFLIIGNLCLTAKLFATIRHYATHDKMNTKRSITLQKVDYQSIKSVFLSNFGFTLIAALFCCPFVILALKWKLWTLVFVPLIAIYAYAVCYLFTLKIGLYFTPFKQAIGYAFKHALGHPFILLLLTCIPVAAITIVCFLPQATYGLSSLAANKSAYMGDNIETSALLTPLFFIINTISFSIIALAKSYTTWCLALKVEQKVASKD